MTIVAKQHQSAPGAPKPAGTVAPADAFAGATPVMRQFLELKAANPDSLLFYRMGDFYELFFDDAEVAARALGITLTKRGKHAGEDIPMCGVPVVSADDYLSKLIRLGHRVAVCEQVETPEQAKKRGSKAVVRREVVRLVTPGTLTEDHLLEARADNHLMALARVAASGQPVFGLAFIDISSGLFGVLEASRDDLAGEIARIAPSEILVPDALDREADLRIAWDDGTRHVQVVPSEMADSVSGERRLKDYFGVATLDAFGSYSRAEIAAAGLALDYVVRAQAGARPALRPPERRTADHVMAIDAATRASLELTRTLSGQRDGSLLAAIDRTVTSAGARLLARRLAAPSTSAAEIDHRLDAVAQLVADDRLSDGLRDVLTGTPDLARALARLAIGRGSPRDLAAVQACLDRASAAAGLLEAAEPSGELRQARDRLADADANLAAYLSGLLVDEPPVQTRDGGFIRDGAHADLDRARALRDSARKVIAGMEADLRAVTEVKSLKIKHNNFLGYHIEVSAQHGDRLIRDAADLGLVHRQTLPTAVRFSTTELADTEQSIMTAGDRALAIERALFDEMVARVTAGMERLTRLADALAVLDLAQSMAALARRDAFVRPKITEDSAFRIVEGRHPVVGQALRRAGETFVANDCDLSPPDGAAGTDGAIWVVTGPNMGGKSTFLRQNALIAVLAQAGGFVPATQAHIGIVDRLFSRVGASDDIARGRSTFMVEMIETAAILNQAGPRALVILDEIGRGTATFDGLSIAWATLEHLHEVNRCRALFATHFHELTALSDSLDRLANATLKVKEWDGTVVFLHEVVAGAADRSYGVQVARLAGLPGGVITRAREILDRLEAGERGDSPATLIADLPLFRAQQPAPAARAETQKPDALRLRLAALDADNLTPRAALDLLYDLKRLVAEEDGA